MPTITFTKDEYLALKPCFVYSGCALEKMLKPSEPVEITRAEAQEALSHLRKVAISMPPEELRPHYYDKLRAVAGER